MEQEPNLRGTEARHQRQQFVRRQASAYEISKTQEEENVQDQKEGPVI